MDRCEPGSYHAGRGSRPGPKGERHMTILSFRQAGFAALVLAATALPAAAQAAKAAPKTADGKDAGAASLTQTPAGVLIALSVKNLPAGEHAFHVHAVGKCEAPFTSAGGHFNPESKKHGLMAGEGHRAGDNNTFSGRDRPEQRQAIDRGPAAGRALALEQAGRSEHQGAGADRGDVFGAGRLLAQE